MQGQCAGITIQPLGEITSEVLTQISTGLERTYHCRPRLTEPVRIPTSSWLPSRKQYDSAHIIIALSAEERAAGEKILGICDVDLCSPILTFVYGAAEVGGRAAVLSLRRLRPEAYGLPPNEALFFERARKVAIHEIGHTIGLKHCFRYDCIMHSTESIEGTDLKREEFCADCAEKLSASEGC